MRWRRSSRSQSGGDCIEVAHTLDALRDSKNPAGPPLEVACIDTFLTEVKRWRKSSRSQNAADCIEVAHTLDALRDTKNPAGSRLAVANLDTFLREVRYGRFSAMASIQPQLPGR